ncbi:MAG: lysine N6-hydroxylase [Miltoncostaeaceae bacterium]|jgi:lysine N6-hydroxylase|nr:lysine N6-hydroxylase [Miltoncostaeaceae bacterium]
MSDEPLDLLGVGIGPFNLSLAALADGADDLRAVFLDGRPGFSWHPGLLMADARLQVPFLADLVSLVDPTSPWTFLAYLRAHERLYAFYFLERFHVPRREYDDYCRWVAESLPSCCFGQPVRSIDWEPEAAAFRVEHGEGDAAETTFARNVVLGVGTEPAVPEAMRPALGERAIHAADYLAHRERLLELRHVTVIGSGQSGAEVVLDLLRARGDGHRVRWLTRSPAFAPMEYSKLGLEHFTPDYTRYFRELPRARRDELVAAQWQLYKAISADTIAAIFELLYERTVGGGQAPAELTANVAVEAAHAGAGGLELDCREVVQDRTFSLRTDAAVLATGYTARRPPLAEGLRALIATNGDGRLPVDGGYRVALDPSVTGGLYVQNAELHTHGVGTPDLGLGAHRAATILNAVTGRTVQHLPESVAFTSFGAP